jgi:GTP-binding protein
LEFSKDPSRHPIKDFHALNQELKAYHPVLLEKIQIVALNKIDLPSVRERAGDLEKQFEKMGYPFYRISGKTGEGMEEMMEAVSRALQSIMDQAPSFSEMEKSENENFKCQNPNVKSMSKSKIDSETSSE